MLSRLDVSTQSQTATKRIVLCCGCAGFLFLAIVRFGLLKKIQAAENTLPNHQVSTTPTKPQPKLVASYGKLPLSFEANQGQTNARVRFLARGGGYTIFLTDDEAVLTLRKSQPGMTRFCKLGLPGRLEPFGPVDPRAGRWPSRAADWKSLWRSLIPDLSQMVPDPNAGKGAVAGGPESPPPQVVRMRLVGGNPKGRVVGLDELPGKSHYFIGNDPKKWRTNVPSYARVKYEGVYPGADLVYYGNQRQLEYDFVVAPGADPNQIKLRFAGADGMRVDAASGDLVMKLGDDELRFHKPAVYQPTVAEVYDRRRRSQSAATAELDGTFVLASNNQVAFRVAGYDPKRALVIDPVLSYSTYLGGSGADYGNGIAVDSSGNAYVTGYTHSADFPTENPLQATNHGSWDAFVAKLNAAGSALVYSTYLGGSNGDDCYGIAVDSSGNAYVAGATLSTDFPTANPLQATNKAGTNGTAFVTKLNAAGSALVYSTYLGGSNSDYGSGIAVDSSGNACVTGLTSSTDFPNVNPLQATNKAAAAIPGNSTGFVAKLNSVGSALAYSTYLGGSGYDDGDGIAVDSSGNAYVTGYTGSTDFPTVNPLQATNHGGQDAFVAKLNSAGLALVYSTYLGGTGQDTGQGIAVDSSDNAYVMGYTGSTDFPTVNPLQATYGGGTDDAFVAKLSPAPAVTLSTNSLSFAGQMVSTTSAEQSVTLTNHGDGLLSITSIAATGDFEETNTCESSVAASGSCTINVTFSPTATGPFTGTLTITDNSNGVASSTQSVALSGTGQDFSFAAASGSSTSATVAPGSPASYTLSVGGEGGFNQSVSFTCTGAPSEATCTVSPNPVTAGSSATNVTITVSTTAPSLSVPRSRPLPPVLPLSPGLRGLLMLALVLMVMAWAMGRRKQPGVIRWQSTMVPVASALLLTLALAGCGGGGASTSTTSNPGTPAGNYTLTVTGTAGSGSSALSHSVKLTLTVS